MVTVKADNALPVGTVVHGPGNDYVIEKVLGRGGFGITYLVSTTIVIGNVPHEVKYAMKEHFVENSCVRNPRGYVETSQPVAGQVESSMKMFRKEAERLIQLDVKDDAIIKINECFEANHTAYYIMQYLDGESLDKYVERVGALSREEAAAIMKPIIRAVALLHQNKVTHYDIKPANIMLHKDKYGKSLRPVLIDFGLAKHYDNSGNQTTTLHMTALTPGFAPAEQYRGLTQFSPQSDVYALAATYVYLLTGKTPPDAIDVELNDIAAQLRSKVDDHIATVLCQAMNFKASQRPSDASQLLKNVYGDDDSVAGGYTTHRGGGR